jgi:hypothetical protein
LSQQNKTRKKAGRPKLPKGEAMGRVIQVRFTAQDTKAIEAAAKARGKGVSEWVRTAIFLDAKERYKGCVIELATRIANEGFAAFGWITMPDEAVIPVEAPLIFHPTREAAIEGGIAWCKEKIDLPPRRREA